MSNIMDKNKESKNDSRTAISSAGTGQLKNEHEIGTTNQKRGIRGQIIVTILTGIFAVMGILANYYLIDKITISQRDKELSISQSNANHEIIKYILTNYIDSTDYKNIQHWRRKLDVLKRITRDTILLGFIESEDSLIGNTQKFIKQDEEYNKNIIAYNLNQISPSPNKTNQTLLINTIKKQEKIKDSLSTIIKESGLPLTPFYGFIKDQKNVSNLSKGQELSLHSLPKIAEGKTANFRMMDQDTAILEKDAAIYIDKEQNIINLFYSEIITIDPYSTIPELLRLKISNELKSNILLEEAFEIPLSISQKGLVFFTKDSPVTLLRTEKAIKVESGEVFYTYLKR